MFIFVTALDELKNHLENPANMLEMKFLLLEQKYLELISQGNTIDALKVHIYANNKMLGAWEPTQQKMGFPAVWVEILIWPRTGPGFIFFVTFIFSGASNRVVVAQTQPNKNS